MFLLFKSVQTGNNIDLNFEKCSKCGLGMRNLTEIEPKGVPNLKSCYFQICLFLGWYCYFLLGWSRFVLLQNHFLFIQSRLKLYLIPFHLKILYSQVDQFHFLLNWYRFQIDQFHFLLNWYCFQIERFHFLPNWFLLLLSLFCLLMDHFVTLLGWIWLPKQQNGNLVPHQSVHRWLEIMALNLLVETTIISMPKILAIGRIASSKEWAFWV